MHRRTTAAKSAIRVCQPLAYLCGEVPDSRQVGSRAEDTHDVAHVVDAAG